MLPDEDPRHGTVAGYNRIPCRDECCRLAIARYKKRWVWDLANGRTRIVSTLGTRRRIQALNALGWSNQRIATHAGMHPTNMTRLIYGETMTRALAERLAATYEALSMRLPEGNAQAIANVRNRAIRCGYLPPLAWLDIDDPDERPDMNARDDEVDEVVVLRILAGDFTLTANRAERYEVVRRWSGADNELERRTGWNVARIRREMGVEHAA